MNSNTTLLEVARTTRGMWTSSLKVRAAFAWLTLLLLLAVVGARVPAGLGLWPLVAHGAYDLVICLLGSLLLSGFVGSVMGALAGLARGVLDRAMTRIFEVFGALPVVIVAVVVGAASSASPWPLVLAVGLTRWVEIARLVRTQVRHALAQDYVTAARALGLGRLSVLWRHIAPNAAGPVIVGLSFSASGLIALRTLVGFVLPHAGGTPNWGNVLRLWSSGDPWWQFAVPSLFLMLTLLSQNVVAEALRGALDSGDEPG